MSSTQLENNESASAVESAIANLDRHATLNAVITRLDDDARERARECDDATGRGERFGPLHGWTVALKDNIDTAGTLTTSGSKFFAERVPDGDAYVARRLADAGTILTLKANLAEFALGATTDNAHWGQCRNPWDVGRIPGGSSGGSAVAVAAGMARVSLGTDTGGSVRLPAAMNGLVGLRPTLGRISNGGVFRVSHAFDTVGPIARTAVEVACVLDVIDGYDPDDESCVEHAREATVPRLNDGVDGLRIGVPERFFFDDLDPAIERQVRGFIESLRALGASVVPTELDGADEAQAHMFNILYPDAAAFHRERMAESPQLFGAEVLDRLRLGEGVEARVMADAWAWRRRWQRRADRVFDDVDVLVTPTTASDVPRIGDEHMVETTHRITRFTYPWAMFSGPSLTVPCGFHDESGMPIGAHLTARPWRDHVVLAVAHAYQRAAGVAPLPTL